MRDGLAAEQPGSPRRLPDQRRGERWDARLSKTRARVQALLSARRAA